jgi:predicted dehydrogenase
MSEQQNQAARGQQSRREFMKGASAVMAGGAVLGISPALAASVHVGGSDEIKIALIGCGGRGEGAVQQALETKGPVKLWAVADAFPDRVERCLAGAQQLCERGKRDNNELLKDSTVDVPKERQFVGLDAYQHCIDAGADLILLATPPGFRPQHFEAAVKAGKHIFAEKPIAVDAPGVRRFMAANDEAKKQGLMVAIGLQRHHDPRYIDAVKRIKDGAIGDIICTRVYWNGGGLWMRSKAEFERQYGHKPSEMEYQVHNWYYFNWLCGDHIVEQHIHNMDVGNWLRDKHPVMASGMGGRQVRTGKDFGQIFDHHAVEFTYDDGTKMFSQCRHIDGTDYDVNEHAHGTKGTAMLTDGGRGPEIDAKGSDTWRSSERKVNNHHQEHHDMFAALRRGEVYNEGDYGADSTMTAILGRMATYSGKKISWEDAINSEHDLSPSEYAWDADPPVMPDADGYYPVPVPGKTDVLKA